MSVLPNLKKDTKEKDTKEKRHERNTKTKKEGKGSGSSASSASTKELWGRHAKWRPKKEWHSRHLYEIRLNLDFPISLALHNCVLSRFEA